jgi:hypothetical protein
MADLGSQGASRQQRWVKTEQSPTSAALNVHGRFFSVGEPNGLLVPNPLLLTLLTLTYESIAALLERKRK